MKRIIALFLALTMVCTMGFLTVQAAEAVTITFRGNGGTTPDGGTTTTQETTAGVSTRLDANPFTREGYTFTGWSTSISSSVGVYADRQAVGVNQNITFYAIWQINVHDLTILSVDGLVGGEVEYGTDLSQLLPQSPQRSGYRFIGWKATNAAGEEIELPTTMPDYDLTIEACWEELGSTYILTFLDEEGEVIATYRHAVGDPISAPTLNLPEGMRLRGWRNAENGKIQALPEVMPAKDLEFLAVLEEIYYTITFMDGNAEVGEFSAAYGEMGMFIDRPAQSGKEFLGWSRDPSAVTAEYQAWQEIELSEDMTVYAIWVSTERTISFMDGTTEVGEITGALGETVTLIDFPAAEGKTFLGWTTEPDGKEPLYTAGETMTLTENMTLYAVWAATKPTIGLKYPTLTFEDVIVMNVYYDASDLQSVTEMGLITYSQKVTDYSVETADAVIPGYYWSEEDGLYYSTTEGIAAKCLGDTIYFAVYYKLTDGTYGYTSLVGYSPKTYAMNLLRTGTAEMKTLVAAMLNYGAAAQTYFSYHTDAPVNADMTDEQKALVADYSDSMIATAEKASGDKLGTLINDKTYSARYATINFEGAFCINYYFAPTLAVEGDVTMYVWNLEDFEANAVLSKENAAKAIKMSLTDSGEYTAAVDGIAAKDLDKAVYVSFVYSDGTTEHCGGVLSYTIGTYCKTQAAKTGALSELAKACAVYGYYAKQLFN